MAWRILLRHTVKDVSGLSEETVNDVFGLNCQECIRSAPVQPETSLTTSRAC